MQHTPVFLDNYIDVIKSKMDDAVRAKETLMASSGVDEVFYCPFEWTNASAELVVVGITPGPTQLLEAYRTIASKSRVGLDTMAMLAAAKKHAAFGGPAMRPNLMKMMEHFGFAELFGLSSVSEFWGSGSDKFLGTSVVPHAAFRKGNPFNGSFADVLASAPLRESFERDFVASLSDLKPNARFVALGPTPLAALSWCAENGLISPRQIMGAFAHPARTGGTAVDVYLGLKKADELNERDPVRHRAADLGRWYQEMSISVGSMRA